MIDPRTVLYAMKAIKETCESAGSCGDCPLYSTEQNRCILRVSSPTEWRLNAVPEAVWRVIK